MRNLKNILKCFFLTLMVVSCKEDEYEAPNAFTDLMFTTTFGSSATRESEVNQFVSFMDLSAGATYHEWKIPKNAFFLKGPIPNGLSNHDAYITNPGDTISTDKTVHVLFKKGDTNTEIKLYNEFDEYTEFVIPTGWDAVLNEAILDTTKTVLKGDKWVYEYTLPVDVYDTVVAAAEIRDLDENVVDYKNLDTIRLKFDDKLVFEDLSGALPDNNARPTTTSWKIYTITENIEDRVNIVSGNTTIDTLAFSKSIGNFMGEIKATRERTELVKSSTDTYVFPVIFKVEPLDEDFVLKGNGVEGADDVIQVTGSSKFKSFTTNIASSFSVKVDGISKTINSVTLATSNQTKLNIVLDNPLTPADATKTVTVSYDGSATDLMSNDLRAFKAFADESIVVFVPTPINQVGTVVESSTNKIQITFDQDIDATTIPATNPGAAFTVELNGGAATISAITVNLENSKTIDITLAEGVFRDDVITIAHNGAGAIRSIGDGAIAAFTAQTVVMNQDNVIGALGDFESDLAPNWTDANGNGTGAVTFLDPTPVTAQKGSKVAYYQAPDGNKSDLRTTGTFLFKTGVTYVLKYKRYLKSTNTTTFSKIYIGGTQIGSDQWGAVATDTWTDFEIEFTVPSDTNALVRFQPVPAGVCDMYQDDLIIQTKESRL
ncbi:SwmB domain-containing protein [Wenyingzhuangia sp. 1_MG-2023]|nr:SwmB domain-containing protein [Wenyingzhuangia sp. 1_MG-2023]